jgi:hypothetical protein
MINTNRATAKPSKPSPRREQNEDAAPPLTPDAGEAVFECVRAEVEALPPERSRRINVHVPTAVAMVLGLLPRLAGLRDEMSALPGRPTDALDRLRDYALATLYAHALTLPRDAGETRLRALSSEALPLREGLLVSAELLAHFGLVDAKRVAAIRSGSGHLDAAQDLTALAALFRQAGPAVRSKTPITADQVERAAQLGVLLVEAFGRRQQRTDGAGDPGENADRLARVYELFYNAYDECRRAVAFLRWHQGDADAFAPSLQQGRRGRSKPPVEPSDGDSTGEAPVTPADRPEPAADSI